MHAVLLMLSVRQDFESQSETLAIASVNLAATSHLFFPCARMTVSSAYICMSTSGHTSGRSFTYKLNYRGPKFEPCGTPTEQSMKDEVLSPTLVHCFLPVR